MTKSDLIERLVGRYPQLVAKDLEFTVKFILEAMCDCFIAGQRMKFVD